MSTSRTICWIFSILLALTSTQAWSYAKSMTAAKPEAIAHTATVLETMSNAGYTYIRVEEEGAAFWIALPETQVSVGDEVVAKGVLYTNKDFGYGYFYPVIVEDAVFTK